jgi:hypothetical protein
VATGKPAPLTDADRGQARRGIDDPHEIETWSPGIRLLEERFFTQDPDLGKLSTGYRLAYKLAG